MKKSIFVLGVLMATMTSAQIKYGIKGGLIGSNLTEKDSNENARFVNGNKYSFYGGGLLEYKFKPNWAFQAELLYANVGYKYEDEYTFTDTTGEQITQTTNNKLNAHQIMLPLSMKYYANQDFNVSAGFNLGYFVSGEYTRQFNGGEERKEDVFNEEEWGEKTSRFYAGPFIGAEYNFKNGLFIDGRYNWGVTDFKIWNSDDHGDEKEYVNSFQIGLGYKF